MINGKSKRISVKTKMSERQKSIFSSSKLGTMRIVVKGHDLVAQIVYDAKEDDWELNEDAYESIIPEELRWRNWAKADSNGHAMSRWKYQVLWKWEKKQIYKKTLQ